MNKYEKALEHLYTDLKLLSVYVSNTDFDNFKELVERATLIQNLINTPVEKLTKEEYDIRNAYIFIKEALKWSDNNV